MDLCQQIDLYFRLSCPACPFLGSPWGTLVLFFTEAGGFQKHLGKIPKALEGSWEHSCWSQSLASEVGDACEGTSRTWRQRCWVLSVWLWAKPLNLSEPFVSIPEMGILVPACSRILNRLGVLRLLESFLAQSLALGGQMVNTVICVRVSH